MTGSEWGIIFLVFAVIYVLYLAAVRAFLLRKAGRKIWKAFIPVLSLKEEYDVSGRPGWFWWHIAMMLPAEFFTVVALVAMFQVYSETFPGGMTNAQIMRMSAVLFSMAVILLLLSLPARFAKAYGLQRCFDDTPPNLDYAVGLIIFPWAFKARFAFSKNLVYTPDTEKRKKKKISLHMFHFFPQYKSIADQIPVADECGDRKNRKRSRKKNRKKRRKK